MIFETITNDIRLYLHVQGNEMVVMIKEFVNDAIMEFVRMKEWEMTKVVENIPLDGSGNYLLSTFLTNLFQGEIALYNAAGAELQKMSWEMYNQTTDKQGYWAMLGGSLYTEGTGVNVSLMYCTMGDPWPLVATDSENLITLYYPDIIKKWAVVSLLKYITDPQSVDEERLLAFKLQSLTKKENRIRKNGQFSHIYRA